MPRLEGMNPSEISSYLSAMSDDSDTIADPSLPPFDLRRYMEAMHKVSAAIIPEDQLVGAQVSITKRGALSIKLYFPVEDGRLFSLYSADPAFEVDVIALFTNLVEWVREHGLAESDRICPLNGHNHQWDLALVSEESRLLPTSGEEQLWRVCGKDRTPIDRFIA